jgi:uncharacterized protein
MAVAGFRILDSDMHLLEPADLWPRYLEPEFRDRAPVGLTRHFRDIGVQMGDGRLPKRADVNYAGWRNALDQHSAPLNPQYQFAETRGWDAAAQLEALDRESIDAGLQFPSRGLMVLGVDAKEVDPVGGIEPALASAIARGYNNWLYDFCKPDTSRLIGAAMVAPHDPVEAARETRRAVEELGFRAIFLLPGIVGGRPWYHGDYDELWRACVEHDIPVCFHGGGHDQLTDYGVGHREYLFMWHTFSHCVGPMSAMVAMIGGGVFERFPTLRAGFLEANCSWAPWLVHRLDEQYGEYVGRFEAQLSRKPSEWFLSNCYVSIEADEAPARYYVAEFGDDNVVFSTDFPHPDSKFPHAVTSFLEMGLPDETRRKMLWDNCVRLYGLDSDKLGSSSPSAVGQESTVA